MRLIFAIILIICPLWADQVTMTNGDRISGSIVRANGTSLVLRTDDAGTVTIGWDSIAAISAEGPLYVALTGGRTVSGPLELANGQFQIETQTEGRVTAARDAMTAIRNQAEQDQFVRLLAPSLYDLWAGFFDLGYAASRGNANTQTFTLTAEASRATTRDKIGVNFTSIYSSSDVQGESKVTANSKRGGVSYNYTFTPRFFAFGSIDLEADEFQNLDLRVVPAGGAGYHALATDATTLDLRAGISGNKEYFSMGLRRNSAEALFGDEFSHKFTATTSVTQKFTYFANLTNTGARRINFDISAATKLNDWLAVQFTTSDRYLSNPVEGRKTNDILFSAGVRLSFAQ